MPFAVTGQADLKCLIDEGIPEALASLGEKDTLLVCGDFNLAPTDVAFHPLRDQGFRFAL